MEATFYGGGLRLGLERGRLSVRDWNPTVEERSPGEGDARVLLESLFPRRPSDLWPIC
jgi:hypothetical protein